MAPMDGSGSGSFFDESAADYFSWPQPAFNKVHSNVKSEPSTIPASGSESCFSMIQGFLKSYPSQPAITITATPDCPDRETHCLTLGVSTDTKCGYSTGNSALADPHLNHLTSTLVPMTSDGDSPGSTCWNSEYHSVLPPRMRVSNLPRGVGSSTEDGDSFAEDDKGIKIEEPFRFTSQISSDESVDGLSAQEEDDAVCTAGVEPRQFARSSSPGVAARIESIVLSSPQEEQQMSGDGSTHSTDQIDLESPSSISHGAQQDLEKPCIVNPPCVPMTEDEGKGRSTLPVKLELKNDDLSLAPHDDDGRALFAERGVVKGDPTASYLMRANSSNIYYLRNNAPNLPSHDVHPNAFTTNKSAAAAEMKESTQAMLFRSTFPAPIDITAIENSRPKRRNVKISKDPQSVAARHRRERISDRIRVLQRLVPGGTKMDTASMLDEAIQYVKFLKSQVQSLETDGFGIYYRSPQAPAPDYGLYGPGAPIRNYSANNY